MYQIQEKNKPKNREIQAGQRSTIHVVSPKPGIVRKQRDPTRAKRVRSERDRPPNREGTVTDLGKTGWQNTDVKQDATRASSSIPPFSLYHPSLWY